MGVDVPSAQGKYKGERIRDELIGRVHTFACLSIRSGRKQNTVGGTAS